MAMSTEKLGRLASRSIDGPVDHAVQVRWGWPLSTAGTVVALVAMWAIGMLAQLLLLGTLVSAPLLYAAVATFAVWMLRRRKVFGDAVIVRQGDKIAVIEAHLARRNPVRDVYRRYSVGVATRYESATQWWRAPAIIVGDDKWFVASTYESPAKLGYGDAPVNPKEAP